MIRLFAALAIPADIAAALRPRQAGIEGARWRPPEALHVTLRFCGDIREDIARDLDAELLEIRALTFDITLEGAGAFDHGEGPDAVWAGVAENAALGALAKACESACRRAGLKPDSRRYRPHVTLAYLRRGDPAEVGAWIQANNLLRSPPIPIADFHLYSSHQTSQGSAYRLEATYPLAQA